MVVYTGIDNHNGRLGRLTYISLYELQIYLDSMAKAIVKLITAKQYAEYKSLCNRYEREIRKKNPKKHKAESKAFIESILANRKAKK